MNKTKVLNTELKVFYPMDAKRLLGKNYESNRRLRKHYVALLAEAMEAGEFNSQNGQTVIVGADGRLYDGQHRLAAQIKANVPMKWLVVTVDNGSEAFMTLDNGAKRSIADYFPEEKHYSAYGACSVFGYLAEYSDVPLMSMVSSMMQRLTPANKMLAIKYGEINKEQLRRAVDYGSRMATAMNEKGGKAIYSKFAYLMMLLGEDEYLVDFVEDLCNDVPDCKTCTVLKLQIANAYANSASKKPMPAWVFGSLLDAYSHFCKMDDCTKLSQRMPKVKKYNKKLDAWRKDRTRHDRLMLDIDGGM